jgi:predicted secreted protein
VSITGAIVLFSITWFIVFFVVLQITTHTQADAGTRVPGTHASAPAHETVKRRAWTATLIALVVWAVEVAVIMSGVVTLRDLDVFGRMPPESQTQD